MAVDIERLQRRMKLSEDDMGWLALAPEFGTLSASNDDVLSAFPFLDHHSINATDAVLLRIALDPRTVLLTKTVSSSLQPMAASYVPPRPRGSTSSTPRASLPGSQTRFLPRVTRFPLMPRLHSRRGCPAP